MPAVRVWNNTRTKKKTVIANSLDELLQKGSAKLDIEGVPKVVLEECGTEIDDNDVFQEYKELEKVFMLLGSADEWKKSPTGTGACLATGLKLEEKQMDRQSKISKAIEAIKHQHNSKTTKGKNKIISPITNESNKGNTSTSNEGDQMSRHAKINIGWIHQGKQVKSMENGGGVRFIEVKNMDEVTVSFIIEKAKQIFFPNGRSSKGVEKTMNFSLGNYSKQVINSFNNLEGEECSFKEYLQQHGLYLSRFNLYLMSDLKENQEIPSPMTFTKTAHVIITKILFPRASPPTAHTSVHAQIDKETTTSETKSTVNTSLDLNPVRYINIADPDAKPQIEITYVDQKNSSFSEVITTYSTTFIKDAKEVTAWEEPSINERENFDPLDYDFSVRRIRVNKETYLDTCITDEHITEQQKLYVFPRSKGLGGFILHEPSEIWGYDSEENLIIGVICSCHGEDCIYTWYRDGEILKSGHTYCCIIIKQCGNYHVKVEYNKFFDVSKTIQIGLLLGTLG